METKPSGHIYPLGVSCHSETSTIEQSQLLGVFSLAMLQH
jgi:hypothetical protein